MVKNREIKKLWEIVQRLSFLGWIVKQKLDIDINSRVPNMGLQNDAGCCGHRASKLGPESLSLMVLKNKRIATVTLYKYYNT